MQLSTHDVKRDWTVDTMAYPACPECCGPVFRVPRRLIDRVISMISPIHRYQCQSWACGWEGNLPIRDE